MKTASVLLALGALALAGCGGTKVLTQTRTVTKTLTVTRTLSTQPPLVASGPTVYVETCCGQPQRLEYRPSELSYYGGQQYIRRIRWITYGGDTALGNGEYGSNDCNPRCAGGHYTYTPVTITLSGREFCRGATAYRDWTIKGIALGPDVFQPRPINSDSGCSA